MSDQFKQHILNRSELMSLMLIAYKCGQWMEIDNADDMIEKIAQELEKTTPEDIETCKLMEEIIKLNTNEVNN